MKIGILKKNKKTIFEATKIAARNLGIDIEESSLKKGNLNLYFSGNLFSFGNEIDVRLEGEKTVKIEISSKSSSSIQIIDWGTNDNLESKLLNEIKSVLRL